MKTFTSDTAAGVTPGMREAWPMVRGRTWREFLLHLAREPADRTVVEPFGNRVLLGFLQALHGALLLQQVAFVLDLGFDRLEFVADFGRKINHRGHRGHRGISGEEFRREFPQDRERVARL